MLSIDEGRTMKKNKDEILEAATELQKQADELPPHGMFGDNAEDIEQMENWASELHVGPPVSMNHSLASSGSEPANAVQLSKIFHSTCCQ